MDEQTAQTKGTRLQIEQHCPKWTRRKYGGSTAEGFATSFRVLFSPTCTHRTIGGLLSTAIFPCLMYSRLGTATSLTNAFTDFEEVLVMFNSNYLLNLWTSGCLQMRPDALVAVRNVFISWPHVCLAASNALAHQTCRSNHCMVCCWVFGKVTCRPLLDCTLSSPQHVAPTKRDVLTAVGSSHQRLPPTVAGWHHLCLDRH